MITHMIRPCKKLFIHNFTTSHTLLKSQLRFTSCDKSGKAIKSDKMDPGNIMRMVKLCIPPLDGHDHKGQAGRIGIIGGSFEYTGAPYFAGISALRVGADLVHIFCAQAAGTVIKSYSPELIVHPVLDSPNAIDEITPWFERLHVLVIGPGLGRKTETHNVVIQLIEYAQRNNIPLVIDADGLHILKSFPILLKNFKVPVVLTPNKIEFERLVSVVGGIDKTEMLGNSVVILRKGVADQLFCPIKTLEWSIKRGGSARRCGGQGDLLSGAIAVFLYWALKSSHKLDSSVDKNMVAASISCYAAAKLIRLCNEKAFKDLGRSMVASDMIPHIHHAFEEIVEENF